MAIIVAPCAGLDVHKQHGHGGRAHARKAVWHVLEEAAGVELLLVNARHVKNLPGRKADVADACWLAQLLECGLLRGSFVPPRAIARLRDLTRYRTKLVQERTQRVRVTPNPLGYPRATTWPAAS